MKIKFVHIGDTTGAHRYAEVDKNNKPIQPYEGAIIGALYVRKAALRGEEPPPDFELEIPFPK